MRRVRQIAVGGTVGGLSMLDEIFEEISAAGLRDDRTIRSELLRQVKIYNYVPKPAEEIYADAVFAEYLNKQNEMKNNGKN